MSLSQPTRQSNQKCDLHLCSSLPEGSSWKGVLYLAKPQKVVLILIFNAIQATPAVPSCCWRLVSVAHTCLCSPHCTVLVCILQLLVTEFVAFGPTLPCLDACIACQNAEVLDILAPLTQLPAQLPVSTPSAGMVSATCDTLELRSQPVTAEVGAVVQWNCGICQTACRPLHALQK